MECDMAKHCQHRQHFYAAPDSNTSANHRLLLLPLSGHIRYQIVILHEICFECFLAILAMCKVPVWRCRGGCWRQSTTFGTDVRRVVEMYEERHH